MITILFFFQHLTLFSSSTRHSFDTTFYRGQTPLTVHRYQNNPREVSQTINDQRSVKRERDAYHAMSQRSGTGSGRGGEGPSRGAGGPSRGAGGSQTSQASGQRRSNASGSQRGAQGQPRVGRIQGPLYMYGILYCFEKYHHS